MDERTSANVTMKGEYYEDFSLGYAEATREEDDDTLIYHEFYQDGDTMYTNSDNAGWFSRASEELQPNYTEVANALLDIMHLVSIEEESDHYEIYYDGDDSGIYDALQESFYLNLHEYDIEQHVVEQSLTVMIDKETHWMVTFAFKILVDDGESNAYNEIELAFDRINDIDGINIPDEVIEEAEAS